MRRDLAGVGFPSCCVTIDVATSELDDVDRPQPVVPALAFHLARPGKL